MALGFSPAVITHTVSPASGERATAPRPAAAAAVAGSWTTYHQNNSRTGVDPSSPAFSNVSASWTANLAAYGQIYAEPLIYNGEVYVVTEGDWFVQINEVTGSIDWTIHLATAFTGTLPCSSTPPGGITSTPVIDPSTNMFYAAGQYNSGGSAVFAIWAVNLAASPHPTLSFTHNVQPPGLYASQGLRGALAIANGRVYIPYGGRAGDCQPYSGWIVGVNESDGLGLVYYKTPANGGAGMWGPSGTAIDGLGNVYGTTGNAGCPASFDYNDSVIKLPATLGLTPTDYFAPTDWRARFDCPDADLGSMGPAFVGNGYIFQTGKTGDGFLVNPNAMGHIGGEIFRGTACPTSAFGGTAYSSPYIYVPCTDGLYAVKLSSNFATFAPAWNHPSGWAGPPIVAGGAVWYIDVNNGTLYALDAVTGNVRFSASVGAVNHFVTPAAANGRVFVPAATSIKAFSMLPSCTTASLAAGSASPAEVGSMITLTASATGCATTPTYDFSMLPPNGSWTNLTAGYVSSNTFTWRTAGLKPGTYSLDVWVRGAGSTARFENFGLVAFVLVGCQSASMTPSAVQQPTSAPVVFTLAANPCTSPLHQVWYMGPTGVWKNTGPYAAGTTATFPPSTLAPGNYTVDVWFKDTPSPNRFDTYALATYQVGSGCSPATITSSGGSAQPLGGSSTFTAAANGCTGPSYQWWLLPPGGTYQLKQPYDGATWAPILSAASFVPGTYTVDAWVKQSNSSRSYDTYGAYSFTLTTCSTATFSAAPAQPQAAGTAITLTASASGCAAEFQFWVQQGGTLTSLGPFSSSTTATWTPSQPGNYTLSVWVRPQGATRAHDTYGLTNFSIN